ncbi:uncharacterized protein LOC142171804 [Nicotiana tabacum]|uniref:Uncharacterized protein LOC142171804 n=1 Tax=Nicotiana tabacum TaxID=4097 RepID=A0AC58T309_TOBAC
MVETNDDIDDLCAMLSECNFVGNPKELCIDSGATRHVCAVREEFTSYAPAGPDETIFMGNSAMAKIEGYGKIFLKMTSGKVKTDERLETHSATTREHGASIKELGTGFRNLERQVGQLATLLSENIPGTLPADTERNPKEIVHDVTLRCGQVLKDPIAIQKDVILEKESGEQRKGDEDKKKKGPMKSEKKKK